MVGIFGFVKFGSLSLLHFHVILDQRVRNVSNRHEILANFGSIGIDIRYKVKIRDTLLVETVNLTCIKFGQILFELFDFNLELKTLP